MNNNIRTMNRAVCLEPNVLSTGHDMMMNNKERTKVKRTAKRHISLIPLVQETSTLPVG